MKLILKTLAISTLAIAAFGADNKLNFHVQFPFNVGKTEMPAGEYSIMETASQLRYLQIMNVAARNSVFLMLQPTSFPKITAEKASIEFRCGEAGCEIANVKNLRNGYVFHAGSAKKPILRTIVVALRSADIKAD